MDNYRHPNYPTIHRRHSNYPTIHRHLLPRLQFLHAMSMFQSPMRVTPIRQSKESRLRLLEY